MSFQNPEQKYRVQPMTHAWPEKTGEFMDLMRDYGFGGAVTNVPFPDGFVSNPKNRERFTEIMSELDKRGMAFWLYDEDGYPSGYGSGQTLVGSPELEAKGFYMVRRVAYQPRHTSFTLDEESERIIWAAKYKLDTPGLHQSYVMIDTMEPVPFTETNVECDLGEREVLYIFCVKPAYEGSQATHNTYSFSRYINILDKRAVRRFIDICYEPIAKALPDVYSRAGAVFTDEPSLMASYRRDYETWFYALAPWVDGMFEEYEKDYGESMLPVLPYVFEGGEAGWRTRVRFRRLVGRLASEAYSGQLASWCEAHGGRFSGHYLGEETMCEHVKNYGDYIKVLTRTSYPGIDVLVCYPDGYDINTAKMPQLAMRKMGASGMMVEICPFFGVEEFNKAPIENMTGVMNLLYLGGVRKTNSYFSADYSDYADFKNMRGYMKRGDARLFNEYVGRLGEALDGAKDVCGTRVYFPLEDAQAKVQPSTTSTGPRENETDEATNAVTRAVYSAGHNFLFDDADTLETLTGIDTLIFPAADIIDDRAVKAARRLADSGVKVMFVGKLPTVGTDGDISGYLAGFEPCSVGDVLARLRESDSSFEATADGEILKARYEKDGRELWFVVNNTHSDLDVMLSHAEYASAALLDPETGAEAPINMGGAVRVKSYRGVFVLFPAK